MRVMCQVCQGFLERLINILKTWKISFYYFFCFVFIQFEDYFHDEMLKDE